MESFNNSFSRLSAVDFGGSPADMSCSCSVWKCICDGAVTPNKTSIIIVTARDVTALHQRI